MNFETQVEELTAQSILNVFIDGLSLGAGAPSGVIDIAKSYHFDLGEYLFRFIDYESGHKVSVTSDWAFPESQLSLKAVFTDAVMSADPSGNLTGTAQVSWTGGIIGGGGCSLSESVGASTATLTGVVGAAGALTVTVEYAEATLHNSLNCPIVGREWTIAVFSAPLAIVGPSDQTLQGSLEQLLSSGGQSRLGIAAYTVIPE